mmetsp:Transcript_8759/g.13246  ORF Transcript_8759/g.13246 Transcript_8759/m.13246 type:complete len:248 (+) Transcript_8759:31-774(+)
MMASNLGIYSLIIAASVKNVIPFPAKLGGKVPALILVDRDGVVNVDVGAPGVLSTLQLELTPGAGRAIGQLRRAECKIALITNQSCVGKGLITEENLVGDIHGRLQDLLFQDDEDAKFDHIFYCSSLKDSGDYRMKPNPGMIEEAAQMFDIDPSDAVMIGDALRDLEAAANAGVPSRILVETGYGRQIMGGKKAPNEHGALELVDGSEGKFDWNEDVENIKPSILPFLYAKNLYSAVQWILSNTEGS